MQKNSKQQARAAIEQNQTALGIELGSTRIKAVLSDWRGSILASGSFDWENQLIDGYWTYHLADVWNGVQQCYAALALQVQQTYGLSLHRVGSIGISAMMHGYLPFDRDGAQLCAFRTWRNTNTEQAAQQLSEAFGVNLPLRWSVAHLHQALLDGEEHVHRIDYLTTLSGYVHWQLTGTRVLGVGDASGMFPLDESGAYHSGMLAQYQQMLTAHSCELVLTQLLPQVLKAGEAAGTLSEQGARLLDPTGALEAGISFCPPEGDAGTGMVATNSVAKGTGNVSAGTSIFAMLVLDEPLKGQYPQVDMIATPSGQAVAMVHANNCTGDLDAWVKLFAQAYERAGVTLEKSELYALLYQSALEGDADCGGLLSYNYYSGEPVTCVEQGRPMLLRQPDAQFSLPNLMRSLLFSSMAVLRVGMDLLTESENLQLNRMMGHGGLFKTPYVAQRLMAGALKVPVAVMSGAAEGGAWGIALLAAYYGSGQGAHCSLETYLQHEIFSSCTVDCIEPQADDVEGFSTYLRSYLQALPVEHEAGRRYLITK